MASLAELCSEAGITIDPSAEDRIESFLEELKRWNRKINLTSISDDDEIRIKHIVDSLAVAPFLPVSCRMMDVGSGGGFPGIPLKIIRSDLNISSVDSVSKKIMFQNHVSRILGFEGFKGIHGRVESLGSELAGAFDVVVSRAFSSLSEFVRLAGAMCADTGCMVAMKGPTVDQEFLSDEKRIGDFGFRIDYVHTYELPMGHGKRRLVFVARKPP